MTIPLIHETRPTLEKLRPMLGWSAAPGPGGNGCPG